MNPKDNMTEQFSQLGKVKLSEQDKSAILAGLREDMEGVRPRRKVKPSRFSGAAAAVAAVAVVAFGVGFGLNHFNSGVRGVDPGTKLTTGTNHPTNSATTKSSPRYPVSSGITATSYHSVTAAAAIVSNLAQTFGRVYPSGPPVSLGSGVKANFNGGAGQYQYQWKVGHWTFDLQGISDSTPGTQLAKNVASYVLTEPLPTPDNDGIVIIQQISSSASSPTWKTTVAWQEGTTVYELRKTGNPLAILKTVNSH